MTPSPLRSVGLYTGNARPEPAASAAEQSREAGIPDAMVYRPKWEIALELYDRAVANGLPAICSIRWIDVPAVLPGT